MTNKTKNQLMLEAMMAATGEKFLQDVAKVDTPKPLTREELQARILASKKQKGGLREFKVLGHTILALNEKNAIRKAKNLGFIKETPKKKKEKKVFQYTKKTKSNVRKSNKNKVGK